MSDGSLLITGYSTLEVRRLAVSAVLEQGMSIADVSRAFCTDRSTIHRWIARFRKEGEEGLSRRPVPGRPRKIATLNSARLKAMVLKPASEYGFETDFWTTRRLIQVIRAEFGVTVSKQTVMRRLHEAQLTYQKPEREYFELSAAERDAWMQKELPKIRRAVRENKAILYFQDEANISLTALLGKTWAPRGETPKQKVTGARGGISAMSALTSHGQLLFRLHDKRITSEEVIDFLGQMLRHHPRRHVVVVMDPPNFGNAV